MAMKWKWKTAAKKAPALVAPMEDAIVQVPDLSPWPAPAKKAIVLLETAAEIEHMLLVQYLYPMLTLKHGELLNALSAEQRKAVLSWGKTLAIIAIEEMGHLMSVQNLRLLLGEDPIFDREEFPPKADLYPFPLRLEPLSAVSLAKYVLAESPFSAEAELDEYRALVGTKQVRHVGVLYGVLGVLFSTHQQVVDGAGGSPWEQFLFAVATATEALDDPDAWHIPEAALTPASFSRQADPDHFSGRAGFFFERVNSLPTARELIRRVGEQGEAPVEGAQGPSHFARFVGMFKGAGDIIAFPVDGSFVPSHDVATDPKLADYEGEALLRATDFDSIYAQMIASLRAYLAESDAAKRVELADLAVQQMRDLKPLARLLVDLPPRPDVAGRASPVFSPPP